MLLSEVSSENLDVASKMGIIFLGDLYDLLTKYNVPWKIIITFTIFLALYFCLKNVKEIVETAVFWYSLLNRKKDSQIIQSREYELPSDRVPTSAPTVPNSKKFIARSEELKTLKEMLKNGEQPLIFGVGGIGKSTLASKLFHDLYYENGYDYFCWVRCYNDLELSMLSAFRIFGNAKNTEERKDRLYSFLRNPKKKLLILDNVEKSMENDLLHELNSLPQVQVVLTSRSSELSTFTPFKLEELSEDDCIKLFYAYCPVLKDRQELNEVKKLLILVAHHTLALELIARAVPRDRSLAKFYQEIKNMGFNLNNDKKVISDYDRQSATVAEHLKILYDINKPDRKAQEILRTLSFFSSVDLPAQIAEWIGCEISDFDELVDSGWLESHGRNYYMHPVVKETILLDKDKFPMNTGVSFIQNLADGKILDENEPYSSILPKIALGDSFLTSWREWNLEETKLVADACSQLGYHCLSRAMYQKALEWNQISVNILEKLAKSSIFVLDRLEHFVKRWRDSKNIKSDYSTENYHQRKHNCNEQGIDDIIDEVGRRMDEIYKQVIPIIEKGMPIWLSLATSYNALGSALGKLGRYEEALEYQLKATEMREKILSSEHPDLATSYNDLGTAYSNLKNAFSAKYYWEMALIIRQKALSPDHPDLAQSYSNVGMSIHEPYEDELFEYYLLKALDIRMKILPPDHPDLAHSYNDIASYYSDHDNRPKELEYKLKALEIQEKYLPPDHPDLATAYNRIAEVYREQEGIQKELEYYQKALEIRKKVLPPDHPDLANSYTNVGATLYELEQYLEAKKMLLKAVEIREHRPECRRELANTFDWLSAVEEKLGNYSEAQQYEGKHFEILDDLYEENML